MFEVCSLIFDLSAGCYVSGWMYDVVLVLILDNQWNIQLVCSCKSKQWWKWNVKCPQEIVSFYPSLRSEWIRQKKEMCNKLLLHSYPNNCQIIYHTTNLSLWICLNYSRSVWPPIVLVYIWSTALWLALLSALSLTLLNDLFAENNLLSVLNCWIKMTENCGSARV